MVAGQRDSSDSPCSSSSFVRAVLSYCRRTIRDRPTFRRASRHGVPIGPSSWTLEETVSLLEAALEAMPDPISHHRSRPPHRPLQPGVPDDVRRSRPSSSAADGFEAIRPLAIGCASRIPAQSLAPFWPMPPDRESWTSSTSRTAGCSAASWRRTDWARVRRSGRHLSARSPNRSAARRRSARAGRSSRGRRRSRTSAAGSVSSTDRIDLSWSAETLPDLRRVGTRSLLARSTAFLAFLHPDDREMVLDGEGAPRWRVAQPVRRRTPHHSRATVKYDGCTRRPIVVRDPRGRADPPDWHRSGHHRAAAPRRASAPVAEARGDRPPGGRRRARPEQRAHRDCRLHRAGARRAVRAGSRGASRRAGDSAAPPSAPSRSPASCSPSAAASSCSRACSR